MSSPPYRPLNPIAASGPTGSLTGFRKRILEANPHLGYKAATLLARKVKRRADEMQEEFDFYAELRVLGIYDDPTARDAIKRIERTAA